MTASKGLRNVLSGCALLFLGVPLAVFARPEGAMSDSIAERVMTAWGKQPAGIIVKVDDGVVEMWGEAPSVNAAGEAVQIARNTVGVRDVISHLQVSGSALPQQTATAR